VKSTQKLIKFENYSDNLKEALNMEGNILDAMRYVGAGLAMIGAAGAGVGIGLSVQGALTGMARNPDTYGNLLTNMILGIAFSEAIAIYCLVIAFLMLFKVV
jgi:F-type H+-transporting ATPase subunit c